MAIKLLDQAEHKEMLLPVLCKDGMHEQRLLRYGLMVKFVQWNNIIHPQASTTFLLRKVLDASVFNLKHVMPLEAEAELTHEMDAKRERRSVGGQIGEMVAKEEAGDGVAELVAELLDCEGESGLWLWKCIRGKFWALWFEPHSGLGYSSQDLAMGRQGHAYVWWLWIGHGKERMVQDLHFRVDDEDTS
nr:hypothetical protein Iba_chr04bCG16190 [Ipomoea batatas]